MTQRSKNAQIARIVSDEEDVADDAAAPAALRNERYEPETVPDAEEPEAQPATKPRSRRARFIFSILGLALLIFAGVFWLERPSPQTSPETSAQKAAAAVPVTVTPVTQQDVGVYLNGLGTIQAANTVAIRTQVDGKLTSVDFVEGQTVKKGQVLAIVDPRPFQAALDQAKAKKVEDQAQLASDAKDLARFKDLYAKGAGTGQAVDQQQAKVDTENATLVADDAAIESAATTLSYATITAPLEGVIGFRQVDAGNIVHPSDTNPITVVTEIKPINAVFTLPQRNLSEVRDAMLKGDAETLAYDQDNTHELGKGKLMLIDNQIDPTTGTMRLKAIFPNESGRLWPGEFVNVRLLTQTLKNAVTVPTAAVQRSSQGLLAWVIKPDNTAENRPIKTGPTEGDVTVVTDGLKLGERVVVNGQYRLKPGAKVKANAGTAPAGAPDSGAVAESSTP